MTTDCATRQQSDTVLGRFAEMLARGPQCVLLSDPASGEHWTRADFARRAVGLAQTLQRQGLGRQTIGLLMGNRKEYFVVDLGVLLAEGVPVSLYPTASAEQIAHYIRDAELGAIFVERARLPVLEQALQQVPDRDLAIIVLDQPGIEGGSVGERRTAPFDEFCTLPDDLGTLHRRAAACQASELATIIYTSGTTGRPKGASLTHANFVAAVESLAPVLGLREGDRVISWLPHAHVAERTCHYYGALLLGLEVTPCADAQQLPALLRSVRPTWFGAVPRFWEKLKNGAELHMSKLPAELRARSREALADGVAIYMAREAKSAPDTALTERHRRAEQTFFAPLRESLGLDHVRSAHTGSAPTPRHVLEFFAGIGLPLRQIYGATETCMCGSAETAAASRLGSIGQALPGIGLRLAADGEIQLQGRPVMHDYWRRPDATREAVDTEGWYATGDLGHVDAEGFVWIAGRKKELIINSSGQNMSPQAIETALCEQSPLIAHAVAIGDGRPYVTALLVQQAEMSDPALEPSEIATLLREAVAAANHRLARVEQVKRFTLLQATWLPGSEEMTPTMKLRRAAILRKYAAQIDAMYDTNLAPGVLEPASTGC